MADSPLPHGTDPYRNTAGKKRLFDADGHLFRTVMEAHRIRSAHLFDPFLAVHASRIEPLPHQITAVYDEMLPRKPLRFLLADDPGAGKTIMAGLLIKELLIRGEVSRCLIVVPGNLVEQWQSELSSKFGLHFDVFARRQASSADDNPFDTHALVLARLDMLSRNDTYLSWIRDARKWDLIICDEAHRMSASYYGQRIRKTKRYRLGELLSTQCRHFLLMTATPHNGKEEDFRAFMALLDRDRFGGRYREDIPQASPQDVMRRLTKEELLKFDATPLFPERRAYTAQFELSAMERELYEAVTRYVQEEMNRAERYGPHDGNRKQTIGFALQILQRRLASSPAAIHASLQRRRKRLEDRLQAARSSTNRMTGWTGLPGFQSRELEEATEPELEEVEGTLLEQATAATTLTELRAEIATLARLETLAGQLRASGQDTKWLQLARILDDPLVLAGGERRKLIIFTEARDTLHYLAGRIRTRLGQPEAVVEIHGGIVQQARQQVVTRFIQDDDVLVLVANDAAGEGINLQNAHLMVNYDLPWNPNRLEQRFGRIHRIGQTRVCHLWNLVARDTREGAVYARLLEKLEQARKTLGGRVYDVMGRLFNTRSLQDLMMESIRYGEQVHVREQLLRQVEAGTSEKCLLEILEDPLAHNPMDAAQIATIAEYMARAEALKLQPYNIQAFFLEAFQFLGGSIHEREQGLWEITHVPSALRNSKKPYIGAPPIERRYHRVCFDKRHMQAHHGNAVLLHPGHRLFDAATALMLGRHSDILRQGTILVDEDADTLIRAIFHLEHVIQDDRTSGNSDPHIIAHQAYFVAVDQDGQCMDMGPAPHLDCRPITPAEYDLVRPELVEAQWLSTDRESCALHHAQTCIVPKHLQDIRIRRRPVIDKAEQETRRNLLREINRWDAVANKVRVQEKAGKQPQTSSVQASRRAEQLHQRLQLRRAEFEQERHIWAQTPRILGCALVIPWGLLHRLASSKEDTSPDPQSRAIVEALAMETVMEAEITLGNRPQDVSARKLGYDIESFCAQTRSYRFIEVKGRSAGTSDVTVTANEIRTALNQPAQFILAIVFIDNGVPGHPHYVRNPFQNQPDPALRSASFILGSLLQHATAPC